jgi:uncharacterized protein
MHAAYRELCAKVDAFFTRVHLRHSADMQCRPGCDACCRQQLSVTPVEAEAVSELVRALPAEARASLRVSRGSDRCVALLDDGRCAVYDARPLVCRSHGVPVRTRGSQALPIVSSCELNFTARGPAAADADCILDQETLSTLLLAVDAAFRGGRAFERVALADVVKRVA